MAKVALVGSENSDVTVSGTTTFPDAGDAFVFALGSNGAWSRQATLTPTLPAGTAGADAQNGANFGSSVALSADGTVALVGAFGYGGGNSGGGNDGGGGGPPPGAVYIFKNTSGTTWTAEQKLIDPSGNSGQSSVFGLSVALSGDHWFQRNRPDRRAGGKQSRRAPLYLYISNLKLRCTNRSCGLSVSTVAFAAATTLSAGDDYGWSVAISNDGNDRADRRAGATSRRAAPTVSRPKRAPGSAYVLTQ